MTGGSILPMSVSSVSRRLNPSSLVTWPLRHISWKIILPYVFLTVVLAGVGSYLATQIVTGSLEERFDNQLAEAGRVTADSVVRTERSHLEVVRSVSFTEGIAEAVAAADADSARRLVTPIAINTKSERIEVLDNQGNRLVALTLTDEQALTYSDLEDASEPGAWYVVQQALAGRQDLEGDKFAQIVETADGFYFYTSAPIKLDGQVVGVALTGTSLTTLLSRAATEALADVTIYDFDGLALASTFTTEGEETAEAQLDLANPAVLESVIAGDTMRESRSVWGRDYDVVYSTLVVRGQAIGLYSIGLPTEFIFSAGSTTRTQVAVLFGLGIVAVLGIGFFVAHRMTQPIVRLMRTALKVTAGDLSARSGVHSGDEIGTLASSIDEMTAKLQKQHLSTIRALTSAIDARDPYTLGHSVRVGQLAVMLGRQIGLDQTMLGHLETGGYLHDIGKIGVRDHVLLKPASLTPEERAMINDHPRIGLSILEPVDLPQQVIDFVVGHHERLDGSGYPKGLRDREIPMVARIASVSDMYDALTTDRPYRLAMTVGEAMDILNSESGKFLDPLVVQALRDIIEEWEHRRSVEPELKGFRLVNVAASSLTAV